MKPSEEVFEERGEVMGISLTEAPLFMIMLVLAALWMGSKRRNRNHKAGR
jgi:hypothetical protein